jgi:HK97 family phage prohead protease
VPAQGFIDRTYTITDMDITRTDRAGRTVTAYAAVFDQEAEIRDQFGHYAETIHRGAFNRVISRGISRVNVFYNHGYDLTGKPNMLGAVPIATPLEIKADDRGLLTRSRYNDGELADAVLAAWAGGQVTGQSFRGAIMDSKETRRGDRLKLVERRQLGLTEYGPTHAPAYAGAGLVAIRSQDELTELIRSMISSIVGPQPGQADQSTQSDPVPAGAASGDLTDDGHSSRLEARRNAMRLRALQLGVKGATSARGK